MDGNRRAAAARAAHPDIGLASHPAEWSKVYQVRAAPACVFNADNARVCARYSDGQQGITRAAASTAILAPSRARTASSLVYSSVGMKSTSP